MTEINLHPKDREKYLEAVDKIAPLLNGLTYDQIKCVFMETERRIRSRVEIPTTDMKSRANYYGEE